MQEQKIRDYGGHVYAPATMIDGGVRALLWIAGSAEPIQRHMEAQSDKIDDFGAIPAWRDHSVKADENSIEVTSDVVDPVSDKTTKSSYKAAFDGKDYPVIGDPREDSIAFQRIDANTLKATAKKGGQVVGEYTFVVSADGRTTLSTTPKRTAKGTPTRGQRCMKSSDRQRQWRQPSTPARAPTSPASATSSAQSGFANMWPEP